MITFGYYVSIILSSTVGKSSGVHTICRRQLQTDRPTHHDRHRSSSSTLRAPHPAGRRRSLEHDRRRRAHHPCTRPRVGNVLMECRSIGSHHPRGNRSRLVSCLPHEPSRAFSDHRPPRQRCLGHHDPSTFDTISRHRGVHGHALHQMNELHTAQPGRRSGCRCRPKRPSPCPHL